MWRVWEGWGRGSGGDDRGQNGFAAVLDVGVRETQDAEPLPSQPVVAVGVDGAILMVGTVGLDDQAVSQTDEVGDVAADHDLPPELQLRQPPVAQNGPQPPLIENRRTAHLLGA